MSLIKTAADNYFVFGEHSSKDWGIILSGDNVFDSPDRDVDRISVPGRNGDLIIDNGRWNNVDVTYNDCLIANNFPEKFASFRAQMARMRGYVKLEDTFNPDEYRMANMSSGLKIKQLGTRYHSGRFDLTFNCKPQRFLKSGDLPMQFLALAISASGGSSQFIPTTGDPVKLEFHCTDGRSIGVETFAYASNGTTIQDYGYSVDNEYVLDFTPPENSAYWRVTIDDPDVQWVRVQTVTQLDGQDVQLDAILAKQWTIKNPTGFRTAPLIEAYDFQLPDMEIHNYTDGTETDYTRFGSNGVPGPQHVYLDCDLQYLYDSDGLNVTNLFYLTNSGSAWREGYIFPELGADEIRLQMTGSLAGYTYGPGLVLIYPRWWRL